MTKQNLEWQERITGYKETRSSIHGEELRWLISRERIFNQATGQTILRSFIRHPGITVIVPFWEETHIILLRQYRYAINDDLWELPAGTLTGREETHRIVATERPEVCAARELIEETGFAAGRLEKIAACYAVPGSGDELMHFFFAFDLQKTKQALEIGEIISEVKAFTLAEIEIMITRGEIRDAKTLIGLFYALRQKS
ncbi:MAG: NUDIX hydrolase [Blastocatellia bacterium]|nr:NUDIX hydrolase [Blastocatellia bacterium]